MSHIVKLKITVKNPQLFAEIARARGLDVEENAHVEFYSGQARGLAVRLPGWHYPVVVQEDGSVLFDNYGGRWGDIRELNKLMQAYAVETVTREALAAGETVMQEEAEDGSIILRIGVAEGGAAW